MKTWRTVTKDELFKEFCPGVTMSNARLANQLNWIEYLNCIEKLINSGLNTDKESAGHVIECMLGNVYRLIVHTMYDRWPEVEEVEEYKKESHVQAAKEYLTDLASKYNSETWPEYKKNTYEKLEIE